MESSSSDEQTPPESSAAEKPPVPADTSKDKKQGKRSGQGLLTGLLLLNLFIILGLAAAAGFWYLKFYSIDISKLRDGLSVAGAKTTDNAASIQSLRTDQRNATTDLQQRLSDLSASMLTQAQEIQAAKEGLLTLRDKLGSNDASWKLAEVEYLLAIANHRVQLAADKNTALAALEAADERLLRLADPRLTEVRASLAAEIQALSAVEEVDITGIVLALTAIEARLDELPLLSDIVPVQGLEDSSATETVSDSEKNWLKLLDTLWQDVKELVVVRKHDRPVEPLLPPDQRHYLIENMKLRLNVAKVAALRGDERSFHQQLKSFQDYLQAFFDPDHASTQSIAATIMKYQELKLVTKFPDISSSLLAIRHLRQTKSE